MNKFSLFWHLKKGRKKWLFTGFILNLLLLFCLSFDAYFRPFYQHTNSFMDSNTFTIRTLDKEENRTSENILSSSLKEGEDVFSKLELKEKCEKKEKAYLFSGEHITIFFAESSLNLLNLGYLPDSILSSNRNGKTILCSWSTDVQESFLYSNELISNTDKVTFQPDFKSTMVQFNPLLNNHNLIRAPISRRDEMISFYNLTKVSCYFTYHLTQDLKDQEFNRLSTLSGGTSGVVTRQFSSFIHPATSYYHVYIPIHNVVQICLYLCSVILAISFFASLLSDYLKSRDKIEDIHAMKIFGRKEKLFILIENCSLPLTLAFTDVVSLLIYVIFRTIFKSVKGFSFYFNPTFLLIFLGEMIFAVLIQTLFAHHLYKEADKAEARDN